MLISFVSAKGSPGVTTSVLALACAWPQPRVGLVVEADLAGTAVLPGLFAGEVTNDVGLRKLASAAASGQLTEELIANSLSFPGRAWPAIVPGLPDPTFRRSLTQLWQPLTTALTSLEADGVDTLVDLGRFIDMDDPRSPLLAADEIVIVTGSSLPQVYAATNLANILRERLAPGGNADTDRDLSRISVLVVGERRPYSRAEIEQTLGVRALPALGFDPDAAKVYSDGAVPGHKFAKSPLVKSAQVAAAAIRQRVNARRVFLSFNGGLS